MENQHRLIKGYRELSSLEILLMNKIKNMGLALEAIIDELSSTDDVDMRWVNIGKTHLQEGLMALTRSVARPESF